ncbi:MAG: aminoacyl-tRNA hydrolase [Gammaproteobacteria bacterium]|nr:aminoacyl-tRNA hydrolase [Gammaproteobacteria bacterium]
MSAVQLIVGLGNPGAEYEQTRHNAGFWFVDALARAAGCSLRAEARFHAEVGRCALHGQDCRLQKPTTFMNRSGQAVAALAKFLRIPPTEILVVHDELDLPPGTVRLKKGGGHGGHNGLRDLIAHLGTQDFLRLRIGVGHPGDRSKVVDYVLHRPSREERELIDAAMARALEVMPLAVAGEFERAMHKLHSVQG